MKGAAKEIVFMTAVIGDTEVLKRLADEHRAAEIFNLRNGQGELASHVALQHGHLEFAMMICSYYPAALWVHNRTGDGLLHMAAKLGHHEFFLEGARLLLHDFQGFNYREFTNYVVNGEGKSLLYMTAEKGYLEAAKLLLENQAYCADVDRAFMGPDDSTALHIATYNRNYDMVEMFLQHAPESTVTKKEYESGYTPLYIAVSLNEPRLAKLFLTSHPSSVYIQDRDGFSPFHLAVRSNETEMYQLFLSDCLLTDKGQNALHIAVEENNEGLICVIINDRRLSELINQQDKNGNTPLHLAAYKGDKKMQKTLLACQVEVLSLRNKADLTYEEVAKLKVIRKNKLFKAADVGDTEVLEQLMVEVPADEIFSERNYQGDLASHVALQLGNPKFTMKICSYFTPALWVHNQTGDGLLHMAAKLQLHEFFLQGARLLSQYFQGFSYYDKHDVKRIRDAKEFLDRVVNGEDKSLLYLAAEKRYHKAAELLLEIQVHCNYDCAFVGPGGTTALHFAIRNKDYDMVKIFLHHDVPEIIIMRQENGTGDTPLHIAVSSDEPRLAKMILDTYPSSADILDSDGFSPLHLAVHLNKPAVAELFLTTQPSIADILDNDGFSPFHLAVRLNMTEMFQLFIRHCPDCCKMLTKKGRNALHIAVKKNIESVISVIVKDRRLSELMINQQDRKGNTPLHLAAYRDDKKMQDTLLGCRAKVKPLKNNAGLTFQDVAKRKEKKFVDAMKEFKSSLLVMTTLIITVTFTASFTLPGGYNGNQPNQGMATLMGLTGFDVFLVTNTLSMSSSIIATASLILFPVVALEKQFRTMKVAICAIVVSILLMLLAVTAGVWVVIGSQRKWLAIFIAFITSSTPLCLVILVKTVMPASEILSIWRIFL